nr:non-structural maintenance of chromosomes element 3 homolog [Ipomoea batatas]
MAFSSSVLDGRGPKMESKGRDGPASGGAEDMEAGWLWPPTARASGGNKAPPPMFFSVLFEVAKRSTSMMMAKTTTLKLNYQSKMSGSFEDFAQFDISVEEKDKLVGEVIRYVLFKTEQSSGCPIKREDLTQLITGKNYRQRNLPAFVINEARKKLEEIFGYEMKELQRARSSTTNRYSQQATADAKSYILISKLPPKAYKECVEDKSKSHATGFTFVVMSIIYLAGGNITQEDLWRHLRRLGLMETDESHPVLGNLKQTLETLVQQRYVHKEKVNGPEGNVIHYELAERALDEDINNRMKEYISKHFEQTEDVQACAGVCIP